jgi:hypothetical protein
MINDKIYCPNCGWNVRNGNYYTNFHPPTGIYTEWWFSCPSCLNEGSINKLKSIFGYRLMKERKLKLEKLKNL